MTVFRRRESLTIRAPLEAGTGGRSRHESARGCRTFLRAGRRPEIYWKPTAHTKKGRKVALLAGLALVVLSVAMVWTYWEEIRFFLDFERLGKNAQGYPERRGSCLSG